MRFSQGGPRNRYTLSLVSAPPSRLCYACVRRTTRTRSYVPPFVGEDADKAVGDVRTAVVTFWHLSG